MCVMVQSQQTGKGSLKVIKHRQLEELCVDMGASIQIIVCCMRLFTSVIFFLHWKCINSDISPQIEGHHRDVRG